MRSPHRRVACGSVVLLARRASDGQGRVGLTTSKRHVSKLAVVRNRARRLMREAYRLHPMRQALQAWDVVMVARGGAKAVPTVASHSIQALTTLTSAETGG